MAFVLGVSRHKMNAYAQSNSARLNIACTYAFRTLLKARNDAQIRSLATDSELRIMDFFVAGSSGKWSHTKANTSQTMAAESSVESIGWPPVSLVRRREVLNTTRRFMPKLAARRSSA